MGEHFRVPLTTVRQPKMRLGVAAMEMMEQLLRSETTRGAAFADRNYPARQHRAAQTAGPILKRRRELRKKD